MKFPRLKRSSLMRSDEQAQMFSESSPRKASLNIKADLLKTFKISRTELDNLLNPEILAKCREQSFTLEDVVLWESPLGELWNILSYGEVLLEMLGVERRMEVAAFQDSWGRMLQLVRGTSMTQDLRWIELPFRSEQYVFIALERLYFKSRFRYVRIAFIIDHGIDRKFQVKMQFNLTLRSPRLKLLIMPMIELYIDKFKLFLKLLSQQHGNFLKRLSKIFSGDLDAYTYYLGMYSEWETTFAEAAKVIREKNPTRYHDFFPEHSKSRYYQIYREAWDYLQRFYDKQFLQGQVQTIGCLESSEQQEATRTKIFTWLGGVPQSLKADLNPLSLAQVLSIPLGDLLRFFVEGVEIRFFKLVLETSCSNCASGFQLSQPEQTDLAVLICPFCRNEFPFTGTNVSCCFKLSETEFYKTVTAHVPVFLEHLSLATPHSHCDIVLQTTLAPGVNWSHYVTLEPGDYRIICGGDSAGFAFTMTPPNLNASAFETNMAQRHSKQSANRNFANQQPTEPRGEDEIPTLPLICTERGKLVHIAPTTQPTRRQTVESIASLNVTDDLISDKASQVLELQAPVFEGSKLCLIIENSASANASECVIRLIRLVSPLSTEYSKYYKMLSLEQLFPYLLKHGSQTLYHLLGSKYGSVIFNFQDTPLLCYQGLPFLLESPKQTSATMIREKSKVVERFEAHEQVWIKKMNQEQGLSLFPGFVHEWLLLLPNEELGLTLALQTFEHFFHSGFPIKLILLNGASVFLKEHIQNSPSSLFTEPVSYAAPGRISGKLFFQFKNILSTLQEVGLVMNTAFFKLPLMEAWLHHQKVDVKRFIMEESTSIRKNKRTAKIQQSLSTIQHQEMFADKQWGEFPLYAHDEAPETLYIVTPLR